MEFAIYKHQRGDDVHAGKAEMKLRDLGVELPSVPEPGAEYVPAKRVGDLVYVFGQGTIRDGKPIFVGRVGAEVSPEDAYKAAQICALNCLAVVKSLVGSLDAVEEVVQVRGIVNSAPDFHEQPNVINGASGLFGRGVRQPWARHARAALGTSNFPMNIPTLWG